MAGNRRDWALHDADRSADVRGTRGVASSADPRPFWHQDRLGVQACAPTLRGGLWSPIGAFISLFDMTQSSVGDWITIGFGGRDGGGGAAGATACQTSIDVQSVPLDLVFMLDKSLTMNEAASTTGEVEWAALSSALKQFSSDLSSKGSGDERCIRVRR